jgi:phosphate transport system permease protein
VTDAIAPASPSVGRGPVARPLAWLRRRETGLWRGVTLAAAVTPLAALGFMLTVLAVKAWPAIKVNGLSFFTHTTWNPGTGGYGAVTTTHGVLHPAGAEFGALALIVGTIESSLIAIVIAVPLAIGAAFAVTERLPRSLARVLGFGLEVLAGLPSVVIGLWGVFTLGPFLAQHVYPIIADRMPDVPILRYFSNPVGAGEGLLTSGIVLALMIVPIIASTTRDLFRQVPPLPKEGGEALGLTDWEVGRRITLPWVRTGIIGATVLGLGRALGETIAIAMISGSITRIAPNIYGTMTSIAATIVTQLDGAGTDATGFWLSSLAEAALVLALISVVVNIAARMIARRGSSYAAPVGQGA